MSSSPVRDLDRRGCKAGHPESLCDAPHFEGCACASMQMSMSVCVLVREHERVCSAFAYVLIYNQTGYGKEWATIEKETLCS